MPRNEQIVQFANKNKKMERVFIFENGDRDGYVYGPIQRDNPPIIVIDFGNFYFKENKDIKEDDGGEESQD